MGIFFRLRNKLSFKNKHLKDSLVDDRNSKLWREINNSLRFDVVFGEFTSYRAYCKGNNAIIYVPINNLCVDSFTHELLHLYLQKEGLPISGGFKMSIITSQYCKHILTPELIEHVGNCLEHIVFYPLYIKMGCNPKIFISDYEELKCTNQELGLIKKGFTKTGLIKNLSIDAYIGKFFAIAACNNNQHNYSDILKEMEAIDSRLYGILNNFMLEWKNYDINNKIPDYSFYIYNFVQELEDWSRKLN